MENGHDEIATSRRARVTRTGLYRMTESTFYKEHCTYLPAMIGWFFFSALLSAYNKFVFGNGHVAFPCPLLLTSIHFFMQWVFSFLLCYACPTYWGAYRVTSMSWSEWLTISVPCGLVTSGDIGLSNLSLVTLTLSFYTMVKASTPIFVLFWAYLFGIERVTWSLIAVVVVIVVGEVLTATGEVAFQLSGFIMCIMGSVLSGARWTLVQLKLQKMNPPLKTTIATMRLLAPSMFGSMIVISLIVERPWLKFQHLSFEDTCRVILLGLAGAFLAISMILCEFHLIMHASAVILMIGGVIKEMLTIFVGVWVFDDKLNFLNLLGCVVVFSGVVLYKVMHHYNKMHRELTEHEVGLTIDPTNDDSANDLGIEYSGDVIEYKPDFPLSPTTPTTRKRPPSTENSNEDGTPDATSRAIPPAVLVPQLEIDRHPKQKDYFLALKKDLEEL